MAENGPSGMRHRKKKGSGGDTGDKPEPKNTETPPKEAEETKDAPVKEASKPKPTRLRACAWRCGKIILFLLAAVVLAIVFLVLAMPRIMSELQVNCLLVHILKFNIILP